MSRSPWIGLVRQVAARAGLGLAALACLAASAPAQDASPAATESPARFCPKDGHLIFVEFDGLDAHAEAWKKTAAYKILNETTTGAMLEDLFQQIYTQYLAKPTNVSGAEALQLLKHFARAGFLVDLALDPTDPEAAQLTIVLRDVFANKEIRPIVARLLQKMPATGSKPQSVVVSGHKLVSVQTTSNKEYLFFWWVEETRKKDIILVNPRKGQMESALEVIDGKKPSILENPRYTELAKSMPAADRTAMMFLDPSPTRKPGQQPRMAQVFDSVGIDRLDVAAGLQNDALLTVARFHPRAAEAADTSAVARALGAVSGPGFDKGSLGAIPAGVADFTVVSLDPKKLLDQVPQLQDQWNDLLANSREKSKLRLQEDVLAYLGPKFLAYSMPTKAGATAGFALPNALSVLSAPGGALPRFAIVADVNNPTAFGKSLDELMAMVNRSLKTRFTPPPVPGAPAPPRGRGPGGPPAPEFRVMPGETKSYVLNVPSELAGSFPAGFRPTIRVGPKQVAIAPSADLARQALEVKGTYAPPGEIADAYNKLPANLKWLAMVDPRDSTPQVLATLPAKLQAGVNTTMLAVASTTKEPTDGFFDVPKRDAPPAPADGPGGQRGGKMSRMAMAGESVGAATAAPPPTPPSGAPGAGGSAPGAAPGGLVFQVDPARLPSAESIRSLLFPAVFTIDQESGSLRFTARTAFPPIPDPSLAGLFATSFKANFEAARAAARRAAPAP